MTIGDWVTRQRRGRWHLVESIVADDAVTKCGRRLRNEANTRGPLVASDRPIRMACCARCLT